MIDIHCHLLPGIDDGPGVVADAIAMAQAAVEAGITTTICTPHMIAQYPNLPEDVVSGVDAFRAELASAGGASVVVGATAGGGASGNGAAASVVLGQARTNPSPRAMMRDIFPV